MHLETLRLYCDVVRLRSFSRGAQLNHVSQSAASQAVQQLEADLGVALIDRTKRPFVLRPEGRAFYDASRTLLDGYEKAKAQIAAVKDELAGTVRVAAIYSVGLHDLSPHVQRFMALYPRARVQLECLHPHKVVDAVLSDAADVGIMSYPPVNRSLSVVPLRSEPMAFVCHPAHRLARRKLVAPADLAGEKFVAFDAGLTIRKAIDRAFRAHNVKVDVVMEFDNIETIKQAITIGAGVSLLPRHTVQKEIGIRTLAAVPLAAPGLARPVGIIHRRAKRLTPTAARFIDLLREAAARDSRDDVPGAARGAGAGSG
ncbi:MAG: LysR family transcriptional regulator [Candidatus Rokuibacteriota bacterium]|nr:MAG: LysR family transcriptional regulator [Candidatus Rokubacteria bacterium]